MKIKASADLLRKYHKGKCTLDERILVETFYINQNFQTSGLSESELEELSKRMLLKSELFSTPDLKKIMLSLHVMAITAAIAIVAGVWTLLFLKSSVPVNCTNDRSPGTDKAIVLSDGTSSWVISASSISYNTSLTVNRGERKVNTIGEAYFEVYKVKSGIGRCV